MAEFLRLLVRASLWLVVMVVPGVLLGLVAELIALVDRLRESSGLLGHAVWFVTGVFCAVFIYGPELDREPASVEGRRRGTRLVVATAVAALGLGAVASLFWSGSGLAEPVVPDHQGVTLTYLLSTVAAVALARFKLFAEETKPAPAKVVSADADEPFMPARTLFVPERMSKASRPPAGEHDDSFRPAGFWGTVAFLAGVPVLLFLDAAAFVLGPFDVFDRWTGPILSTALMGGLAWGLAAARREWPRIVLLGVHVPLVVAVTFYVFGVIGGGLLVGMGASEGFAAAIGPVAFWIGLALGCGPFVMGAWDLLRQRRRGGRLKA